MGRDRGEARKRITSATSSAVMSAGAPPLTLAHIGVSTDPGLTQFTRTPNFFTSTAIASVNAIRAALLELYAVKPGNFSAPITPLMDETFTIAPARPAIIAGNARFEIRNALRILTWN